MLSEIHKSVAWISKNHQTALVSLAEVKRFFALTRGDCWWCMMFINCAVSGKEKSTAGGSLEPDGMGTESSNSGSWESAGCCWILGFPWIPIIASRPLSQWQRHRGQGAREWMRRHQISIAHLAKWRGSDRSTSAFAGIFQIYIKISPLSLY